MFGDANPQTFFSKYKILLDSRIVVLHPSFKAYDRRDRSGLVAFAFCVFDDTEAATAAGIGKHT